MNLESTGNPPTSRKPTTIRVAVGTTNPCKINAVRKAFEDVFVKRKADTDVISTEQDGAPVQVVITSHNVSSGVPDQPFGDSETREGAMNRAIAAYDAANKCDCGDMHPGSCPDFAVGLEGGLEVLHHPQLKPKCRNEQNESDELWCMAWMAILGTNCKPGMSAKLECDEDNAGTTDKKLWGYAKTGSFLLPPALSELVIRKNMELGHADDIVFKRVNSKHGGGTVGILTGGEIDRTEYYVHALKLALVPWIRHELYCS